MEYEITKDNIALIKIQENLAFEKCSELSGLFREILGRGIKKVVVDFSMNSFLTSTAIGILISYKQVFEKERGELFCTGLNGETENILRACRIDEVIRFFPTAEEAVSQIR